MLFRSTVRVPYDIVGEAEVLGCSMLEGTTVNQPSVSGSPWRGLPITDVPEFPVTPEEMLERPRVSTLIEASEKLKGKEDVFVTANCNSPESLAMHLLGLENLIMGGMMTPHKVFEWVDALAPYTTALARRLSEIADNVSLITSVQADLMTPDINKNIIERDRKIVSCIKGAFSTVHNCGQTLPFIDGIVSMGSDVLSLETSSDPETFLRRIRGRCRTIGCLNPVSILLESSPERIVAEAARSSRLGFDLVGPECGVPPMTADSHLRALSEYRERLK